MKIHLSYFILLFVLNTSVNDSYGQDSTHGNNLPDRLNNIGISFGISEVLEGYHNFHGGIKTGSVYASTFDANVHIDLQKLLGVTGASFYSDFENHSGNNPTSQLTGDLQIFDKHNSGSFSQILEFWYQQRILADKVRLKVGKIDANSEFSIIENGLEFINSSTQVTPTLLVFPTFPDPVPAVNIFFKPGKLFYTNLALDDANKNAKFLNFHGDPVSVQPTTNGILILSESGLTWNHIYSKKKNGNLKLGLWTHTGTFHDFNGLTQHTTRGLYLIFNQNLWQPEPKVNPNRGLRMFLEYALTDSSVASIYAHYGSGIIWQGMNSVRQKDVVGLTGHFAYLSPGLRVSRKTETNIETFYKLNLNNWLSLKTDLQYIIHPGGRYRNVLVGILILNFELRH